MTQGKHTPGPWQGCLHLRANADETCGCGYRGGIWSTTTDTMICEMGGPVGSEGDEMIPRGDRATQIADHWLIAAAPELLDTLKAIHKQLVDQGIHFGPLIADAETVIAKAEGRS